MLAAALRDGTAHRRTTFEVFARRLPDGRRYGVVAGTGTLRGSVAAVHVRRRRAGVTVGLPRRRHPGLSGRLPVQRRRRRLRRGRAVLPGSPVLSVHGSFAECVLLETLALSIFNHDTAIASAAARMVSAAEGRTLIEMGSRRTHEQAAVAAARAAYIAGFTGSSNLEAQRTLRRARAGHQRARVHAAAHPARTAPTSSAAFRAQVDALGVGTTLLVDTYDITTGVANAVAAAGTELGAVRIDSGDLGVLARQVRAQLDGLGADEDPDRGVGRPRRVLDRRAARRARRHLRRRHLAGDRFRRTDREHGLQARRGRRHAGGEAQQPQGIPRRTQEGGAAGQGRRAPSSRRSSTPPASRRRHAELSRAI